LTTPQTPPTGQEISPITIEEEMRRSYLDYAMSVIVSRALPDVRDGLKPVHRRILYAMRESGFDWSKPFRKSARIVGDVMGRYHPHGDSAIYDAMVRMAQGFAMRLPLIEGQGNFGSMDGDPPAAMRYTEARLAKVTEYLLRDIDKETVEFQPNYDDTTEEPSVLPAEFPNLLVNGAGGIAVGMATNIPTHNLGEVIDACTAYIDNPDISLEELMDVLPGPDFPTGGVIIGKRGILEAYRTGRGSVVIRARHQIEEIRKDRFAIVISEMPFQVNKARMIERIAELVNEKVIEGISELRDESDRDGVRVVIELKRDATPDVVLNQLFRHSQMQVSFGVNMLAIHRGRPLLMNVKEVIAAFVEFREDVINRRTLFELNKARDRAHVLVGLAIAVANIDDVIALIRSAPDPQTAKEQLMARAWPADDIRPLVALIADPDRTVTEDGFYYLSETQAKAILDLRLHRLTGLEREKIDEELSGLSDEIRDFLDILGSRDRVQAIMKDELGTIRQLFANPRRTSLEISEVDHDIEDLIEREDVIVTVSHAGYIKRVPLSTYRAQRRGGKGRTGMATRDEDFVERLFAANTHTPVLFFTTFGRAFELKVWRLPVGTPQSRGKPMINLLPLQPDERIATVMPLPEADQRDALSILFATSKGEVRRNALSDFLNIKSNGKIAMKLEDEDGNSLGRLVSVATCRPDDEVLLTTRGGKCIRFPVDDVRVFTGRTSTGVRGIRLAEEDELISMSVLRRVDADTEERDLYLRLAAQRRRQLGEAVESDDAAPEAINSDTMEEERFIYLSAAEEFILSITDRGFGKRSSAYEYRTTGRGGSGIANIDLTERNGSAVVAAFPVAETDDVMLVTDGGQVIRTPVAQIRLAGRKTQGVTVFRVGEGEKVVSVTRLEDTGDGTAESEGEGGLEDGADQNGSPEGEA